jgi:RNA polymerase sigma-70 factor (ECF subfamily)
LISEWRASDDMHEQAVGLAGRTLTVDADRERERQFEAAVAETLPLVFRVAYSVLRDRAEAEDVAQEAFARGYRKFNQLRDHGALRAWLVRIVWRLAINRQRSNRRRAARESAAQRLYPTATPANPYEQNERAAQLWVAIDALPPKLRIVTVLASIEGHDIREVASLLGLPIGTVKSRLFLARTRLKELLTCTGMSKPTR